MRPITLLLVSIFCLTIPRFSDGQSVPVKDLKTEIREVTVFLNSAQIFESGSAALNPGKTTLRVHGLSPYVDEKSIQVKGDGDFTILSVNHKLNFLKAGSRDEKLDSLHRAAQNLETAIARDDARVAVLHEKAGLLAANRDLGGSTGVTIAQLKLAIELFESETQKIKEEELRIRSANAKRREEIEKIKNQLKELNDKSVLPTSEIEIRVSAEQPVTAKFRITYLTGNAGWYPKYDVRVTNIKKPLEIIYKAEVFQNTGTDWKNVKLRFSNANPQQNGTAPQLNPWQLTFARLTRFEYSAQQGVPDVSVTGSVRGKVLDAYGQPMPGVNVMFKGTTIGTSTDVSGEYSLTLPAGPAVLIFSFIGYETKEIPVTQSEVNVALAEDVAVLQEVVVAGYSARSRLTGSVRGVSTMKSKPVQIPMATTTIENQTTVEIEVAEPYSIKSNGEKLMVDLKNIEAEALYQYYAIPKIDKDAFLVARIPRWDQYNLLEGEANLYFEDAYVGRTVLNARSLADTLDISLGRDKNIVIGREKNAQFCKTRTLGANTSDSRAFKIVVRNKKSQPVRIILFDQIPVSIVADISVHADDLSNGVLDEKSGKVTWDLTIDPKQQKELSLAYEVKYPRRERVYLE